MWLQREGDEVINKVVARNQEGNFSPFLHPQEINWVRLESEFPCCGFNFSSCRLVTVS